MCLRDTEDAQDVAAQEAAKDAAAQDGAKDGLAKYVDGQDAAKDAC